MIYSRFLAAALVSLLLHTAPVFAQVTEATYQKATYFLSGNIQEEVYHLEVIPNWLADSSGFWHVTNTREGKRFFVTHIPSRDTRLAFDHDALAVALEKESGEGVDSKTLPFSRIRMERDGAIGFNWNGQSWTFRPAQNLLESKGIADSGNDRERSTSPDGQWEAFRKGNNLYIKNLRTGRERQLSTDGRKGFEYANRYGWSDLMQGEGGERPSNFHVVWSPDSKKLLTGIQDLRLAEKMYLLDYSKPERFRPELYGYYRGSPGDTTVVYEIPVVFDVEEGKRLLLNDLKTAHFMPKALRWTEDGKHLYGVYYPRGFKTLEVIEVDADSGDIRKIYRDTSETHIDYDNFFRRLGDDKFLLASERSGWRHLYLHDWQSGKSLGAVTKGEYVITDLVHVDEDREQIYFMGSGKEPGRNVYYPHLYRVNWDGTGLMLLTPEDAYHQVSLSSDKQYFVDNFSTVIQPTQSVLRSLADGKLVMNISEADDTNLKQRGYQSPRMFSAIAKDGKTEIYGIYYVPSDFDPNRHYPVIDYTYTGPHTAVTPKTYKAAVLGLQQPLAELGFLVVTVDGLGTSGRSKAFQDVSYRNLGDGTTDHVLAIRQLASQHAFIDLDRVGIFGHSAGGYDAARAMLLHPDFYKVGVSSAGNHDQRMEKAWWPEMYMGYPVGDFYEEQSNITHAANLKGKLLLAHGGMDENVNPSGTYKFIEALISAGKDFDLFIWPSRNHSFGRTDGDYFTKKRWDYFIEHLMGEKPLLHYKLEK
ncbi:MAG: DPP IV N-terminal domain-containing protein [Lunatimonas sp.]|uniref:S9 family peptidase n=1 Tax=Lunatimonas sp. TaxID=2060141 RepID=UPI00263BB920|nr:DPP IV N-terminal domain-containing protein [Lunatimonas sp.]MCC5939562.1 DPP IV N-terminal domain-containing protein [Lunatimonas sp.]